MFSQGINTRQLLIGFTVLIFGTLFYYFFRSTEHTYFLKFFGNTPQLGHLLPSLFVILGNSLPTFVHVIAFILLTAGLIAEQKKGYIIICFAWLTVDSLFELGQGLDASNVQFIPAWFSKFLFLENTRNYILYGRFDYFDLLSIGVGTAVAYLLLIATMKKGETE